MGHTAWDCGDRVPNLLSRGGSLGSGIMGKDTSSSSQQAAGPGMSRSVTSTIRNMGGEHRNVSLVSKEVRELYGMCKYYKAPTCSY